MQIRVLLAVAMSSILVSSCNKDSEPTPEGNDRDVVFTSHIAAVNTKVSGEKGDIWDEDDEVRIYMANHTNQEWVRENIPYRVDDTGKNAKQDFSPVDPGQRIFYPDNNTLYSFFAYYPYNPSVEDHIYPVNVGSQNDQSAIDLIYAKNNNNGEGFSYVKNKPVSLIFTHQLVKIVIHVTGEYGSDPIETVTVSGMYTEASFNLKEGELFNPRQETQITLHKLTNNTYEAIVLPLVFNGKQKVTFKTATTSYQWVMQDNTSGITELEAGYKYTFTITLQQKDTPFGDITITEWLEKNASGEAET